MEINLLTKDEAIELFNDLFEAKMEQMSDTAKKLIKTNHSILKIDIIVNNYCEANNIKLQNLKDKGKNREITTHRHILFYVLIRNGFKLSYIGAFFNRDHATVINGNKRIEGFVKFEPEIKKRVEIAMG